MAGWVASRTLSLVMLGWAELPQGRHHACTANAKGAGATIAAYADLETQPEETPAATSAVATRPV